MTGKGKTPLRAIRVPDSIWFPAQARAKEEDTTISAVVRDALQEYGTSVDEESD